MSIEEQAIANTERILGYPKQPNPSREWLQIEEAFIDGYVAAQIAARNKPNIQIFLPSDGLPGSLKINK